MLKFQSLFLVIVVTACTGVHQADKLSKYIARVDSTFQLAQNPLSDISFHYSGCGGFYIESDGRGVLIDPYFSNTGPMAFLLFKQLKHDTAVIDSFFKTHKTNNLRFLLTAHTHIDHVGDYPYVFQQYLPDDVQLVGNKTLSYLIPSIPTSVAATKKVLYEHVNQWIYSPDSSVRVMPMESRHAPHFLFVKFAPTKSLKDTVTQFPTRNCGMPEGENYNYLIDFLDEKKNVKTRVFSAAGAAAASPWGIPDPDTVAKRGIDVLLLCAGSHQYAKNYPEDILSATNPRLVIVSHWENFFRSWEGLTEKPRTVPFTNIKKFTEKIKESDSTRLFVLPNVGTRIGVRH